MEIDWDLAHDLMELAIQMYTLDCKTNGGCPTNAPYNVCGMKAKVIHHRDGSRELVLIQPEKLLLAKLIQESPQ